MIDHLSLPVTDIERSRAFYDIVLAALGQQRVMQIDDGGYRTYAYGPGEPDAQFWIGAPTAGAASVAMPHGFHIAFSAPNRRAVDAFHRAAMGAGARDNGPPGLRPHYHANYYAAFVFDLDGHHLEAVCHLPDVP